MRGYQFSGHNHLERCDVVSESSPPPTNFVLTTLLGTIRNNFNGWVGISVTVGNVPLTVTGLGRIFAPGNSGTHTVKVVNASNSQDVTGGSVTISMPVARQAVLSMRI